MDRTAENRVGRDDASQVDETATTNKLSRSREAAALRIGELDPLFTQLFTKNFVLFLEVRNHPTLLSL